MADNLELIAHARKLRADLNAELPNGVGNTIDALCDRLEARTPTPPAGDVEQAIHKLIEAARMYEASCRLGGKDQEFASRKLDAAKAAALAAGGGERWLPIESAPKDLTEVLVFCPQLGVTSAQYECRAPRPFWSFDVWDLDSGDRQECWPTHWQHLPAPPALNEQEG